MNVTVNPLVDIEVCYRVARFTQGLQSNKKLSVEKWKQWLMAEESQIKPFSIELIFEDIPSWVHVHIVRHAWILPFVRTQRPDSYNPVEYDRRKAPQDAPVSMTLVLNPQSLINIARKRLCMNASKETRAVVVMAKKAIAKHDNPYVSAIAFAMMPNCEYRGNVCWSARPCGKYVSGVYS